MFIKQWHKNAQSEITLHDNTFLLRNIELYIEETAKLKSEHFLTLFNKCLTMVLNILSPNSQIYFWKSTLLYHEHTNTKQKDFKKETYVNK